MSAPLDLPFITGDLPGIGGRLKTRPDHFIVRELPAYDPSGAGEHAYLTLTREDRNTDDLARELARVLEVDEAAVGYAGRKDRTALVTQVFSIHLPGDTRAPEEITEHVRMKLPGARVEAVSRHANKLRLGHLRANEFDIRVAGVGPDAAARAAAVAARLGESGWANYFGEQRFGKDGENVRRGREVLRGRSLPRRRLADLFVSAYQSHLFNLWLAARIERGDFPRILPGDVAGRLDSGGLFLVEDVEADTARFQAGEIAYTGPLFGRKMKTPVGIAAEFETALLKEERIREKDFRTATGTRRPGRLPLPEMAIEPCPEGLRFRFALPKGSYATVLLREFMK